MLSRRTHRSPWLLTLLVPSFVSGCSSSSPASPDSGSPAPDAANDARGDARDGATPLHDGRAPVDASKVSDAQARVDAAKDAAVEAGPPPCTTEAWSTYAHDAQRTGASGGCVTAAVASKWHYAPTAPSGRTFESAFRAVAQSDGAFLGWMASDAPYTGTTAMDRVDATGARVWTWDSGTDTNLGNWPTIASTYVAIDDDGLYLLDPLAGTVQHSAGVDWWGQTIADSASLYVVNQMQADGPGLFVGAVDPTTKLLWQQNLHQACGNSWGDIMGGIALDAGVLFYAPQYQLSADAGASLVSGLYAFDGATGTPKWNQPTTPTSAISVGGGLIYEVESSLALVARKESDGTVAWSTPLGGDASFLQVGAQAPVLAHGLAIVATSAGVLAFRASTGVLEWKSSVVAPALAYPSIVTNGCGGNIPVGGARETTMAAALATGTLIVTAPDAIDFVSLADGHSLGAVELDGGIVSPHDPIVVGSRLYVVDATGLVALE